MFHLPEFNLMSEFDEKSALSKHITDYNRKERQRRIRVLTEDMLSREALRNPAITTDKIMSTIVSGNLPQVCLDICTAIYDRVNDLPIPDRT